MVSSHESLFLFAPFEQWEIDNPKAFEDILIAQTKTVAHLQAKRTKLNAGLIGIVSAKNQHQIAVIRTHDRLDFLQFGLTIELVDGTFDCSVSIILDINQPFGPYLRPLDEVGQLVELLTTVASTARHTDTADIGCIVEHREASLARESSLQFHELHAKTQVGLVTSETFHGLVPSHLL